MFKEISSPTLESERLILRKFNEHDLPAFFTLYSNNIISEYLPLIPVKSEVEALKLMSDQYLSVYETENTYHYAIVLKDENKIIGAINISDDESHSLGYILLPDYFEDGFIVEASILLINHLKKIEYPYITAMIDTDNDAAVSLSRELGMRYKYTFSSKWLAEKTVRDFRLYQLNLSESKPFMKYWQNNPHYVESSQLKES